MHHSAGTLNHPFHFGTLRVCVHDALASIDSEEWACLFPGYPDSFAYVALLDRIGMEGFNFKSIVVSDNAGPLLYLPLFITQLDITRLMAGAWGRALHFITKKISGLTTIRLLGVGLVEGEWSQPGIRPDVPPQVMQQAWRIAHQALSDLSIKLKCPTTAWLNHSAGAMDLIPKELIHNYTQLHTYPCAMLALPFRRMDDYLGSLGYSTRKDLRRKLRTAETIEIVKTEDPSYYSSEIHQLYQNQVAHAELSFGVHKAQWFQSVTQAIPGSYYVLYLKNRQLLAFNLLFHRGDTLIDKYFAMDQVAGRQHHLYFQSWLYNVQTCLARGISTYHAGPGAETTKARLGCAFIPIASLFCHRNILMNALLKRLSGSFAYAPQIDVEAKPWLQSRPQYERSLKNNVTFAIENSDL